MVNTADLKSVDESLVGSSPIPGTTRPAYIVIEDTSNAKFTPEQRKKLIQRYKEFKSLLEKQRNESTKTS